MDVESVNEVKKRWAAEGRTFRLAQAVAEVDRQACVASRRHEDGILAAATDGRANAHTREVAQQIRDHRHRDDGHAMACPRTH